MSAQAKTRTCPRCGTDEIGDAPICGPCRELVAQAIIDQSEGAKAFREHAAQLDAALRFHAHVVTNCCATPGCGAEITRGEFCLRCSEQRGSMTQEQQWRDWDESMTSQPRGLSSVWANVCLLMRRVPGGVWLAMAGAFLYACWVLAARNQGLPVPSVLRGL